MSECKTGEIEINDKEVALQTLVDRSDKKDLVQCIRMISIYVSMYKKHFGELPTEYYEQIFINEDGNNSPVNIFETGLSEAIAMLDMIITTSPGSLPFIHGKVTIN